MVRRDHKRFKKYHKKLLMKPKLRCYHCNELGHFSMNCSKPRNMTKTLQSIMHKHPRHANRIYFQICQHSDDQESEKSDSHDSSSESIISNGNAVECNVVDRFDDYIKEDSSGFDPEDFYKGIYNIRSVITLTLSFLETNVLYKTKRNLPIELYLQ